MSYVPVEHHSLDERRDGFHVLIDERQARADVVLSQLPDNCLSPRQFEQLRMAFERLDSDPRVRAIVLRADGDHFSNMGSVELETEIANVPPSRLAWNINAPLRCGKPVVAANRGHCFGMGFALSLACDLRIVTETTQYGFPLKKDQSLGATFGWSHALKLIGSARMREILLRSRPIPGVQAFEWGIATDFVADSDLEEMTDATVRELLESSACVHSAVKNALIDLDGKMEGDGVEPPR
ncbi:2-oxoglutaroyl-CoA hydrolase [Paraburkholderia sp. GAS199]|uniref:enoyl-CoA hydratase/isomerase family protein n=1 Tax=Paraburkholderia sp. GAS199 TaxID=3035126 RepID=UPI003D1A551E